MKYFNKALLVLAITVLFACQSNDVTDKTKKNSNISINDSIKTKQKKRNISLDTLWSSHSGPEGGQMIVFETEEQSFTRSIYSNLGSGSNFYGIYTFINDTLVFQDTLMKEYVYIDGKWETNSSKLNLKKDTFVLRNSGTMKFIDKEGTQWNTEIAKPYFAIEE